MKVFISRNFPELSEFGNMLSSNGIEVEGESLIIFSPLDFILPEDIDWIFFYSRTGVEYFYRAYPKIAAVVKIAALGGGTADAVLKYSGRAADFCGDGIPESTAKAFKKVAAGKKVVFVRARESKKSIQTLLKDDLTVLEIIAYNNSGKTDFAASDADILVFTSSLNAQTYCKKFPPKIYQRILAIGKPTAEALAEIGFTNIVCADSPDEKTLAGTVLKIISES